MPGPTEEGQALAIFNHAAEEIRFFKGQQWRVTNYTLLAYGALVAAPQLFEDLCWKAVVGGACFVAVFVAGGSAVLVLYSLNVALKKERDRMKAARWKLPLVQELHDRFKPRYRRLVTSVLWVAVGIGFLLAIVITYRLSAPWAYFVPCLTTGAV
jgi:hypothetical protein